MAELTPNVKRAVFDAMCTAAEKRGSKGPIDLSSKALRKAYFDRIRDAGREALKKRRLLEIDVATGISSGFDVRLPDPDAPGAIDEHEFFYVKIINTDLNFEVSAKQIRPSGGIDTDGDGV